MSWVRPTLNIDLGELAAEPPELAALAGMVNVACGAHAGDEATMAAVIARAPGLVCAHPSYPDREGFGRRRSGGDGDHVGIVLAKKIFFMYPSKRLIVV